VSKAAVFPLFSAGLVMRRLSSQRMFWLTLAPPGDLLTVAANGACYSLQSLQARCISSAPMAPAMFADTSDARIPNGPDRANAKLLAYPVSAGWTGNQMDGCVASGNSNSVVTGSH